MLHDTEVACMRMYQRASFPYPPPSLPCKLDRCPNPSIVAGKPLRGELLDAQGIRPSEENISGPNRSKPVRTEGKKRLQWRRNPCREAKNVSSIERSEVAVVEKCEAQPAFCVPLQWFRLNQDQKSKNVNARKLLICAVRYRAELLLLMAISMWPPSPSLLGRVAWQRQ